MEHESHHHHHPHGTGTRWLDITLGVAATIVSLVSLWLGLHSAHEMEKLVTANSFPYLEQGRSMSSREPMPGTDRFRRVIEYDLINNGVGPARVEWVEYKFNGQVVGNLDDLLDACCHGMPHKFNGLNRRGNVDGTLIRPGAILPLFTWAEPAQNDPAFDLLHKQMNMISWRTCYCSVFDECYIQGEADSLKPKAIKECRAPAKPFRPAFRKDL